MQVLEGALNFFASNSMDPVPVFVSLKDLSWTDQMLITQMQPQFLSLLHTLLSSGFSLSLTFLSY